MFPLKAARKIEHTPYITYALIVINVLVFVWQMTLPQLDLYRLYFSAGLVTCAEGISVPSAVTSMFLHGSIIHLLGNMLFLFAFGPAVEDYLGKAWYTVFYLAAGAAGSALHLVFSWGACVPTIGASGAIMGVMGGFVLLYPGTRINTLVMLFRIPVGVRQVRALYLLGTFFVLDLINGLMALGPTTATTNGVAVWAHVGGFLVGFAMAFIAMTFKPLPPVDPIYLSDD
ncbi:MAG: rhomboid family intramembrane serine protease [Armatimonadetes bacterium]|nr:rhomboid family intramembrane serine protease [Anaerolineae bacterium]